MVWKAISRQTQQIVALKKCFDAFQSPTDAQRTYREVMFLKELHGHENIVQLQNIFESEANDKMDIYIVFDFMESDLHAAIKLNALQEVHKQYVLHQIMKALKYLHSGGLIHRDMKPSNVLLNSDCQVKLCDFGLARSVATSSSSSSSATTKSFEYANPIMTEYVATRWYRAPELLLGSTTYTKGVDIWAVGCILAEMIVGKAVFPGDSTLDQLERVLEATGRPSPEDTASMRSREASQLLDSVHIPRRSSFQALFPRSSAEATDFMRRCFQFNPEKRPEAVQLLSHPYLSEFHDPQTEPSCPRTISIPLDDNVRLTIDDYKKRLSDEISKMDPLNRVLTSPATPQKPSCAVPGTAPAVNKQYSNRSTNALTPTTCHTSNGHSSPTPTSKGAKIQRSASSKSISVAPVPYRGANVTALVVPRSPKIIVGSRLVRAATPAARPVLNPTVINAPSQFIRPTSSGAVGTRLTRTPSANSLILARSRVASPAGVGKRPNSSYYR